MLYSGAHENFTKIHHIQEYKTNFKKLKKNRNKLYVSNLTIMQDKANKSISKNKNTQRLNNQSMNSEVKKTKNKNTNKKKKKPKTKKTSQNLLH